jgi:hypothetical protein
MWHLPHPEAGAEPDEREESSPAGDEQGLECECLKGRKARIAVSALEFCSMLVTYHPALSSEQENTYDPMVHKAAAYTCQT